ncbi:hypothetical protein [Streptomyces sp. NPDC001410]|uniref:hypothetical protein n=1 Tax=Streptomyces sp. NPDC001410 TaxID=3364574 RepID=UPI0036B749C1
MGRLLDPLVTVVVTHPVRPNQIDDFLDWQHHMVQEESKFEEFRGTELGLYPTVVLLTLALSPLHLRLWIGLLVGKLLSSFIMSFLTMPYYVNPLLGRWLRPPPHEPAARSNLHGLGVVAVAMVFWAAVFYLVTVRFWTLP